MAKKEPLEETIKRELWKTAHGLIENMAGVAATRLRAQAGVVTGSLVTEAQADPSLDLCYAVLGVEPDSNEPEVTAAHRRRLAAAKRDHKRRLAEQIESAYRQICSTREF